VVPFGLGDGGDIAVVPADAVHPAVLGRISANNKVATIQNIDPREGK
jgi:hypothetical protein